MGLMKYSYPLPQPLHAVGDSLLSASQHMGTLATATGALMATVGTRTCLLRRGRHTSDSDDEQGSPRAAVGEMADEMDREEVTPVPGDEIQPAGVKSSEVVAITVARSTSSLPLPTPPSSSFGSFRSAVSGTSTASLRSIMASMPARHFVIRPADDISFESDVFGEKGSDFSSSSGTLGGSGN